MWKESGGEVVVRPGLSYFWCRTVPENSQNREILYRNLNYIFRPKSMSKYGSEKNIVT